MLIPVFYGLRNLTLLPASIFVFALQVFVLLIALPINEAYHKDMDAKSKDPHFYNEMSVKYSKWMHDHPNDYDQTLHRLSDMSRGGDPTYRIIMSQMALRDGTFQRNIASIDSSYSPQIEADWKKNYVAIKKIEDSNPVYDWGYKTAEEKTYTLFTYQFVHSGLMHFAMNAFFFLLLAPLVELALGSTLFLSLYLFGGAFAAYFYSLFQSNTLVPLVGASGSICFLLGFIGVYFWKHGMYYFYWLLPMKGYYGFVKLPAYVALIAWFLSDLSGQMSSTTFESVAHSAHLGGMIFGAVMGATYRYLKPIHSVDDLLAGRKATT
jgi:membrane associated rhomboid family serine protease